LGASADDQGELATGNQTSLGQSRRGERVQWQGGVQRVQRLGQWIHVVHTYDREDGRIYINGRLDGAAKPLLDIKSPARMWIGGWYHNYDFVVDIDEVRISRVARSADWIKLQFENQQPQQTLVGPLVQPGDEFSVSQTQLTVAEGRSATVTAKAGGAQKVYWILKRDGRETIVATDRFSYTFDARRVVNDQAATLQFKAIYANTVKTKDIAITVSDDIPEPVFTLSAPATWDGRQMIEVVPDISNLTAMKAGGAGRLGFEWSVDDVAVIKQVASDRLILKRSQGSGTMHVSVAIDNGGAKIVRSATIVVKERFSINDWVQQPLTASEQPEDNQFFARNGDMLDNQREGTLAYAGTLASAADSVFVRVFADDKLYATETSQLAADKNYFLTVKLKAGLVKYRTEFGSKTGDRETILHTASNLVCGDAFLIDGQSNAEATDVGRDDPTFTSDWIRSYGSTATWPPHGKRTTRTFSTTTSSKFGRKRARWGSTAQTTVYARFSARCQRCSPI
jgi:hypothetical protein